MAGKDKISELYALLPRDYFKNEDELRSYVTDENKLKEVYYFMPEGYFKDESEYLGYFSESVKKKEQSAFDLVSTDQEWPSKYTPGVSQKPLGEPGDQPQPLPSDKPEAPQEVKPVKYEDTLSKDVSPVSFIQASRNKGQYLEQRAKELQAQKLSELESDASKLFEQYQAKAEQEGADIDAINKELEQKRQELLDKKGKEIESEWDKTFGADTYELLEPTDVKNLQKAVADALAKNPTFEKRTQAVEAIKSQFISKLQGLPKEYIDSIEQEVNDVIASSQSFDEEGNVTLHGWKTEAQKKIKEFSEAKARVEQEFKNKYPDFTEVYQPPTDLGGGFTRGFSASADKAGKRDQFLKDYGTYKQDLTLLDRASEKLGNVLQVGDNKQSFADAFRLGGQELVESLLSAGYSGTANDLKTGWIAKKVQKGEELTEGERAVFDAKGIFDSASGVMTGAGFKLGQVVAQGIPFIEQMALMGWGGIGKGVASATMKKLLAKEGVKLFSKEGAKILGKELGKATLTSAKAAPLMPISQQRIISGLSGRPVIGEDGQWTIDTETVEGTLEAITKGLATGATEYLSESLGGLIGETGGVIKRVAKWADIPLPKLYKEIAKIGKLAKFQGTPTEILEELINIPLQAPIGDQPLSEVTWNDIWETVWTTAGFTSILGGVGLPASIPSQIRRVNEKALVDTYGREKVAEIRDAIISKDKTAFVNALSGVDKENVNSIVRYARSLASETMTREVNTAKTKPVKEAEPAANEEKLPDQYSYLDAFISMDEVEGGGIEQLTKDEYLDQVIGDFLGKSGAVVTQESIEEIKNNPNAQIVKDAIARHREVIEMAEEEGKTGAVPDRVLKDYPDLIEKWRDVQEAVPIGQQKDENDVPVLDLYNVTIAGEEATFGVPVQKEGETPQEYEARVEEKKQELINKFGGKKEETLKPFTNEDSKTNFVNSVINGLKEFSYGMSEGALDYGTNFTDRIMFLMDKYGLSRGLAGDIENIESVLRQRGYETEAQTREIKNILSKHSTELSSLIKKRTEDAERSGTEDTQVVTEGTPEMGGQEADVSTVRNDEQVGVAEEVKPYKDRLLTAIESPEVVGVKGLMKNKGISFVSEEKSSAIREDIKANGVRQPIIVNKNTGEILDGTHRLDVANELGIKKIPVIYVNKGSSFYQDESGNILRGQDDATISLIEDVNSFYSPAKTDEQAKPAKEEVATQETQTTTLKPKEEIKGETLQESVQKPQEIAGREQTEEVEQVPPKPKSEQLKEKEVEIKNRLANNLEGLIGAIGGVKEFSGEQRASVLKYLSDILKDLGELTALKGEQLYEKLKEYLKENKITLPDDILNEVRAGMLAKAETPPIEPSTGKATPSEGTVPPIVEVPPAKERGGQKEGENDGKEKKLLNRFLNSAKLSDKFKEEAKKYGTTYTAIPNDVTAEEADYILANNRTVEAERLIRDDKNKIPPRVRALMGVRLINMLDSFADSAEAEGDMKSASKYRLRSVEMADWLDETVRDWGRGIQILASTEVSATLSPKSQLIRAKRMMRRQRDKQLDKNKKDIDGKKKSLQKVNKDAVEELIASKAYEALKQRIVELERQVAEGKKDRPIREPKGKIAKERAYRATQWANFKKHGKENLSASIAGLNSQQIEDLGNIIASYVREGIYLIEDLVVKLQKDYFKNTGNVLSKEDARKLLPDKVDGKALEDIEKDGLVNASAEKLAERVDRMLKDPRILKDDPIRQMIDTLFEKIKEKDAAEKIKPEGKTAIDKIRDALLRRRLYTEVWEEAKEKVILKINTNEELSEEQKSEYNKRLADFYNEIIGTPFSEKQAESATRKGIKDLGLDIDKVVRDHYTVYDAAKRTLQEKLIEELGLNADEAKLLSDAVSKAFDKIAIAKKRAILQRGIKPKEIAQPKKAKMAWERLIELTNMGAFSDSEFAEAYADAWGFPKLTEEQVKEIERLAKKVYDAPEGFQKYERVQDLLAYQAKLPGIDIGEVAMGMWYAAILSGFRTQFKNIFANTANTISELVVGTISDPRNLPRLVQGLSLGWVKGGYDFMYVLRKGYMPIRGFKIESPIELELHKFRGGGWNPSNWFKYVPRFMVAADAFSYAGLKEMRAYEMAMNEARKENMDNMEPSMSNWAKAAEILHHTSERLAEAEAQATQEGLKKDSKARSERAEYQRRVWEIMEQGRGQEIIEDSAHFAAHGTFNYPTEGMLGFITDMVAMATQGAAIRKTLFGRQYTIRPLKFIVPFTRIIANVANEALNYFPPVGLARGMSGGVGFKLMEETKIGKGRYREYTADERKKVWIKMAIGISAQIAAYLLSEPSDDDEDTGFEITANGYGNYKKNYELKESGWQPYSIRIGKKWLSYQYTPLVLALAPIGFLRDAQKYKQEKYKERDVIALLGISYYRSLRVLGDMTWATSLTGLIDAMNADNEEQAITYAENVLATTVKGIIYPKLAEQTVQFIDMAMENPRHEASGVMGKVLRDIPIVRDRYNRMLNAVGEPVMFDPISMISTVKKDDFWDFVNDHKINIGKPNQKSLIWDDINKIERPMTDDEYFQFISLTGPEIRRRIMEDIMPKNMTNDEIKRESENIKTDIRQRVKIEMFGWGDFRSSYPDEWDMLKKHEALRSPITSRKIMIGRDVFEYNEEQLKKLNNIVMVEYSKRVIPYLKQTQKVVADKKKINPLTERTNFEYALDERWLKALERAEKKMMRGELVQEKE